MFFVLFFFCFPCSFSFSFSRSFSLLSFPLFVHVSLFSLGATSTYMQVVPRRRGSDSNLRCRTSARAPPPPGYVYRGNINSHAAGIACECRCYRCSRQRLFSHIADHIPQQLFFIRFIPLRHPRGNDRRVVDGHTLPVLSFADVRSRHDIVSIRSE